MQTQIKLIIEGYYYDSQIYSGFLYLWQMDGALIKVDWSALIRSFVVPDNLKFSIECAFLQGEYLYGNRWKPLFQDAEFKQLLQHKFHNLAQIEIRFSRKQLDQFVIFQQDSPFPFPHADNTIYNFNLYVASQEGVFESITKTKDNLVSRKMWDAPVVSISASYKTLALAAGSEGLFQQRLTKTHSNREPFNLNKQHSGKARWLYASLFSSSYFNEGYLAEFKTISSEDKKELEREFVGIQPSESIFSNLFNYQSDSSPTKYTWGVQDKLCRATHDSVEVVRYNPQVQRDYDRKFYHLGEVKINQDLHGDVIGGDSSLFGFIVESDNGLLIIDSEIKVTWLEGEPTNWRVFPRSKYYTNQLHVIYEEYLCVFSFNHDYFVDQSKKKVGVKYREFDLNRKS
ncbi:hypothetical protein LEP3755_40200 [Leptolyngbya sp. NIES-3755]|nr:hypothetical protein LEP3755_40200 [Leptolyngbya sp. NIES-3755]